MTVLDRRLIYILIIGAVLLFAFRFVPLTQSSVNVRIELAGKVVREFSPSQENNKTIKITLPGGEANLQVKDGAVRLLEMPASICPRKICSHSGWVKRPGETLICVPNRLVIRLVQNNSTEKGIDAISQ